MSELKSHSPKTAMRNGMSAFGALMMKRLATLILAFVLWLLLTWPVDSVAGGIQTVVVGILVAVLVAVVMREPESESLEKWFSPARWFWALVYLFVLGFSVLKANIDVAYRVLHPAMPIRPGIVKVKSKLTGAAARTILANSITLTPGTLTVDITDEGILYVHWIDVKSQEIEDATDRIIGRFEWFITKIFE